MFSVRRSSLLPNSELQFDTMLKKKYLTENRLIRRCHLLTYSTKLSGPQHVEACLEGIMLTAQLEQPNAVILSSPN